MKIASYELSNGTLRKTRLALDGTAYEARRDFRTTPTSAKACATRLFDAALSFRVLLICAGDKTGTVSGTFPRTPAT